MVISHVVNESFHLFSFLGLYKKKIRSKWENGKLSEFTHLHEILNRQPETLHREYHEMNKMYDDPTMFRLHFQVIHRYLF